MELDKLYKKEAIIFGQYILGVTINDNTVDHYVKAMNQLNYDVEEWEEKVLNKAINKPSLIPYYDAAMALRHRNALLRKKLYLMMALLETRPEYTSYFLNKEYPKSYYINIIGVGIRSVFRAIIGLIIYQKK